MDTLVFASLMGLYYWFARLRLGYTFSAMLLQPVVIAVFVGLLLGNMETAMIIGAGMQLVYLGVTSTPGGNVPSDPALAACISTVSYTHLDVYKRQGAMNAMKFWAG